MANDKSILMATKNSSSDNNKRGYRCQRCRNHNIDVARKGHVDRCPYRACRCLQCILIERRTDTHRLIKQKSIMNSIVKYDKKTVTTMLDNEEANNRGEKRTLRCAKCANHDVEAALKNHKQRCPYRHCKCSMCHLVDDYRNILKDQIKTRRVQNRQRSNSSNSSLLADVQRRRGQQNGRQKSTMMSPPSPSSGGSNSSFCCSTILSNRRRQSVIVSSSSSSSSTMTGDDLITLHHPPPSAAEFGASIKSPPTAAAAPITMEATKHLNELYILGHLTAYTAFLQQCQQHRQLFTAPIPAAAPIVLQPLPPNYLCEIFAKCSNA